MPDEKPTLAELKETLFARIREAETAAYAYFRECDVGAERTFAHEVYERIRNSTRV